ncbi:MAG: chromosomal replication initiator DnaA [Pseudomonadota bacterium]
MADQLRFDLATRPAQDRDAFFVAPANALALAALDGWQSWTLGKMLLSGPAGSGKTHLAHVWAADTKATILTPSELVDHPPVETALVLEDLHALEGDPAAEQAAFHHHNLALAHNRPLLITGRGPAGRWPIKLPDLASRLQGTPSVSLDPPDDGLLAAIILKLFTDRQLTPDPDLIPWLVQNTERSFEAAQRSVERLDDASLAERRSLTVRFAAGLLRETAQDAPDERERDGHS